MALLAGPEHFSPRATMIWTIVAVLVTVLSLAGPLSSATTTGSAVSLALMHLVVGAVAILGFRRTDHDQGHGLCAVRRSEREPCG